MRIYVGRWDLLPAEWELLPAEWELAEKSEEEIGKEVARQNWTDKGYIDPFVGIYTPKEFEETFNQSLTRFIDSKDYWIKIF